MYEIITGLMDLFLVICLGYCAYSAWIIYHRMPVPQSKFLFWGFLVIAFLDIGFIVIDFWWCLPCFGTIESTGEFAEGIVAVRAIPAFFLALGMYYLRKSIQRLF